MALSDLPDTRAQHGFARWELVTVRAELAWPQQRRLIAGQPAGRPSATACSTTDDSGADRKLFQIHRLT